MHRGWPDEEGWEDNRCWDSVARAEAAHGEAWEMRLERKQGCGYKIPWSPDSNLKATEDFWRKLSRMTGVGFYFQNERSSCSLENNLEQECPDSEQRARCEGSRSNSGKKEVMRSWTKSVTTRKIRAHICVTLTNDKALCEVLSVYSLTLSSQQAWDRSDTIYQPRVTDQETQRGKVTSPSSGR